MIIKVLGSGCANCKKLHALAEEAVRELGIPAEIVKVEGMKEIVSYGVLKTPALVVDEKVKIMGRVPGYQEVVQVLKEMR